MASKEAGADPLKQPKKMLFKHPHHCSVRSDCLDREGGGLREGGTQGAGGRGNTHRKSTLSLKTL
jgi:hypothetical protein